MGASLAAGLPSIAVGRGLNQQEAVAGISTAHVTCPGFVCPAGAALSKIQGQTEKSAWEGKSVTERTRSVEETVNSQR